MMCGEIVDPYSYYDNITPDMFARPPSRLKSDRVPGKFETMDDRNRWFGPGNDKLWGRGNWVACTTCPPDDEGWPVYHHKKAHAVVVVSDLL